MLDTQEECLALLEQLRWNGQPRCPYCNSTRSVPLKRERRYHCNNCFTSYSVTVGTLFHRTHVELPKWFQAIELAVEQSPHIDVRQLAVKIGVNKDTAARILNQIRKALREETAFLEQLLIKIKDSEH